MAVVGAGVAPTFLTRAVLAQTGAPRRGRLVVVFQRGAADGLNMVAPYREPAYYSMRPTIAIQPEDVLDLDGRFGLHPAMASLKPFWDAGELAAVHACGSPDPTRSHFDAQDFMESGTPGVKTTPDGWLNRALPAGGARQPESAFQAVAMGPVLPRTLAGCTPALAMGDPSRFGLHGEGAEGFAAMYAGSVNAVLHGTGRDTFEAVRMLRSAAPDRYQPANGAMYPRSAFGDSMRGIAQLMKSDLGVEVAFAEMGDWDTHQNQGGLNGQLASRLREWSDGLAAFRRDLGSGGEDVVVVTMSEFGRTARQNGSGGTDHGHANVMFALGAPVSGGRVLGEWPGLDPEHLNENRDLRVTTDFRQVLHEVLAGTLRPEHLQIVFPGFEATSAPKLQLLKAMV